MGEVLSPLFVAFPVDPGEFLYLFLIPSPIKARERDKPPFLFMREVDRAARAEEEIDRGKALNLLTPFVDKTPVVEIENQTFFVHKTSFFWQKYGILINEVCKGFKGGYTRIKMLKGR